LKSRAGTRYADFDPIVKELAKKGRIRIDANMISPK
jgi:hypothetical protein